jgi:hypothetical protein
LWCYDVFVTESELREKEWLVSEAALASSLTDRDRIRILRDLLQTVDAIRKTKSPGELQREEEVRRFLDETPGRERYAALAERLGCP